MKRFLLQDPNNAKWVEAAEKRVKAQTNVEEIARLVRREMFPELHLQTIEAAYPSSYDQLAESSSIPHGTVIEARQRQNFRRLMKELLSTTKYIDSNSKLKGAKQTCSLYKTRTWEQRSMSIFFFLHDSLGNKNIELTCSVFSTNQQTFDNWIRQKSYFGKWIGYVESFTVATVLQSVSEEIRNQYREVDQSSKVIVDAKFKAQSSDKLYVSAASAASGNTTRQMASKKASKSKNTIYIRKKTKSIGSGRKVKYQEEELYIVSQVVIGWETGNPLSKSVAYDTIISKFGHEDENEWTEFERVMKINSGNISPGFSQWLSRVLLRHHFSIRKESISQTVPLNWLQICIEATALIRQTMSDAGVTRLVNADEMFLQFYPKETHLIAPTNASRVGSNRSEDGKKGCTIMVACEMFESKFVSPFLVMTGTRDGRLAQQFQNWDGCSKVTFQPKHWMDKQGSCIYLEWLSSCYHGEKIGLIWDAASSHFCEDVMEKAAALNIVLGAIPPGCTSLLQICDLIANKPIKQAFKKRYVSWKIRNDPGPGGKYKVDRKDVIIWLEEAVEEVDTKMSTTKQISKAFAQYGQDFRSQDQSELAEYLAKHEENGVYASLLSNQRALDLE